MRVNNIKHTNFKVASVLAARHFTSIDASLFFFSFPLSVCHLFSFFGGKKNKTASSLWWFLKAEHRLPA